MRHLLTLFLINSGISLAIWNIPVGWKWACYILLGFGGGLSGLCYAWCHEICADDNEERALVSATMNEMAYVCQAWLPLVSSAGYYASLRHMMVDDSTLRHLLTCTLHRWQIVWQQVDAPQYRKGFITSSCISTVLIITALSTRALHQKQIRQ